MGMIFDVKPLITRLKKQLQNKRKQCKSPVLAAITIGEDQATFVYSASQQRLAQELDVDYRHWIFKKNVSQKKIIDVLSVLNADTQVHGIMIHRPLPRKLKETELFSSLLPTKDIEGVNLENVGRLFLKAPLFIPPTVQSVLAILDYLKIDLYGKNVVLIGFSSHIGKPLSILLADRFATVTITHIATYDKKQLPFYTRHGDVLISCVGKAHFIRADWIKRDAIVIDVGVSRSKAGEICGDVDSKKIARRAKIVTPVPGGIGALTPLFLYRNLFESILHK